MTWTVLVTDGEQRAALASVRSLGRAGHVVHVCSTRGRTLSGASRYCHSETRVPDPLSDPEGYARAIVALASKLRVDVLLAISEASLLAVLPHRSELSCAVPFAAVDRFSAICDKALVLDTATTHSIAVPRQCEIHSLGDVDGVRDALTFPVVIKPSRSVTGPATNRKKVGVLYATDQASLEATLADLASETFPVLLQERIEGPGFAISVMMWNNVLRAAFAHRRIREKPPSGGVSTLREAIPIDRELLDRCVDLLRSFEWQGVAMVEFKLDARTGTPYLMEINGRLWGSLQLAIDAGVDFPLMLVSAAMGQAMQPAIRYDETMKTRWEMGDVDHLITRLRHSPAKLNLPQDAPSRLRVLGDFVRGFGPGIRNECFTRMIQDRFSAKLRIG